MRGLIVYGKEGYEDGGEFVDQVNELVSSSDDIEFALAEELAFFVDDVHTLKVMIPNGDIISEGSDKPEWAMLRTSDWKVAYGLEKIGIKTFPSSTYIRLASDKVASHMFMADVLPALPTLVTLGTVDIEKLSTPYIIKSATGFGGYGVKKAERCNDAVDFIEQLETSGNEPLIQAIAPTPDDLRVYIMDGKICLALLRKAAAGSDRANLSQGGTAHRYELNAEQESLVRNAIDYLGEDGFISIDFLFDADGNLMFNEMNCFPGITFLKELGIADDFVRKYVDVIQKRTSATGEQDV